MNLQKILYRRLNREQRAAASKPTKEVLCLACPGADILKTVGWRMALIAAGEGGSEGILALTFSERSARELTRRANQAADEAGLPRGIMRDARVWTVPGYAVEILRLLAPGEGLRVLLDPWKFWLYLVTRAKGLGLKAIKDERAMSFQDAAGGVAIAWKTLNDELLDLDHLPGRPGPGSVTDSLRRIRESLAHDRALDHSLAARKAVEALEALETLEAQERPEAGEVRETAYLSQSAGTLQDTDFRSKLPFPAILRALGRDGAPEDGEDAYPEGKEGEEQEAQDGTGGRQEPGAAAPQSHQPPDLPAASPDGRPRPVAGPLPLRHLLVEGFQDATIAQARLVTLLGARAESVFISGDDDRAIAPGRGIGARNTPPFWGRRKLTDIVTVGINERASEDIARTSGEFAAQALPGRRHPKSISAHRSNLPSDLKTFVFPDRKAEARWVASRIEGLLGTAYRDGKGPRGLTPGDFAIVLRSPGLRELDRSPRHSAFARALAAKGIPYRLNGGANPFDVPATKALLAALELLNDSVLKAADVGLTYEKSVHPVYRGHSSSRRFEAFLVKCHAEVHRPEAGAPPASLQKILWDLLELLKASRVLCSRPGLLDRLGLITRIARDCDRLGTGTDPARFQGFLSMLRHCALEEGDSPVPEGGAPPDAVDITTVQAMGSRSRPCVFLADVEQLRFPLRNGTYTGLLPKEALATALKRGAYRVVRDKEARLFYTGLTRACRYLYVTSSEWLPRARRPAFRSEFFSRVHRIAEWDGLKPDPEALPPGLIQAPPARPLDEAVRPGGFPEILSYLCCPKSYEYMTIHGLVPEPQALPPRAARRFAKPRQSANAYAGAGSVSGTSSGAGRGNGSGLPTGQGNGSVTGAGQGNGSVTGAGQGNGSVTGAGQGNGSRTAARQGNGSRTAARQGNGSETTTGKSNGSESATVNDAGTAADNVKSSMVADGVGSSSKASNVGRTGARASARARIATGTGTGPGAAPGDGAEPGAATGTGAGPGTAPGNGADPGAATGTGAGPGTAPVTGSGLGAAPADGAMSVTMAGTMTDLPAKPRPGKRPKPAPGPRTTGSESWDPRLLQAVTPAATGNPRDAPAPAPDTVAEIPLRDSSPELAEAGPDVFYAPAEGAVIVGRMIFAEPEENGGSARPPELEPDPRDTSPAFPLSHGSFPEAWEAWGSAFRVQLYLDLENYPGERPSEESRQGEEPAGDARQAKAPPADAPTAPDYDNAAFAEVRASGGAIMRVPRGILALQAARSNLEWAVRGILAGDFPMRPNAVKCAACGFRKICVREPEPFKARAFPPDLLTAGGPEAAPALAVSGEE